FGAFLFYPVSFLLKGAFVAGGRFSLKYFALLLASPLQREAMLNSFAIALLTTLLTTVVTLPLAHLMTRFEFAGKALLSGLLLVPLILPPFVGAIGLRQLLARFGSLNLGLMDLGITLIFGFSRVVPVQIFDAVNDLNTNPLGYALVVFVLLLTLALFLISKKVLAGKRYEMIARGHTAGAETPANRWQRLGLW